MTVSRHCVANIGGNCVAEKCQGEITAIDVNISTAEQAKQFYELAVFLFREDEP